MDVAELLIHTKDRGGSDLHLSAGSLPLMRLHGQLTPIEDHALTRDEVHKMVYEILNDDQRRVFEEQRDLDFAIEVGEHARFRVNVFNQRNGEGAVFRVIPTQIRSFQELGLPDVMQTLALRENGLVLVTGPTGSGKSTTLAAMIDLVNSTQKKHIITLEDPIEFVHRSKGCLMNQREIGSHTKSFAAALRAALREDPDVILVGETRDLETAQISVRAALTGHLVFTTLHTNDCPSTVARMIDMGIPPFLLSSALLIILAQRLGRRICKDCKQPVEGREEDLVRYGHVPQGRGTVTLYRGAGCATCNGTGMKGRVAIYEVMPISEEIRDMILKDASTAELREQAQREGMKTLRQAGMAKVLEGVTTVEEVLRVTLG